MYRENHLKKQLLAGQKSLGCWLHSSSPIIAEIMALAGFDGAIIDLEHGPDNYLSATQLMQAMGSAPTSSIIRVPWNDPVQIKRALDSGCEGIMVPEIRTAEEARVMVSACLYPPKGVRGAASVLNRASGYGLEHARYLADNGKELLVIAQIESLEAVKNIEAICAIDGIDVLFIGHNDLSGDCGGVGDYANPVFTQALDRAEKTIKQSNKTLGGLPKADDPPTAMFDRGYDFVISASDVLMLRDAALENLKQNRRA